MLSALFVVRVEEGLGMKLLALMWAAQRRWANQNVKRLFDAQTRSTLTPEASKLASGVRSLMDQTNRGHPPGS